MSDATFSLVTSMFTVGGFLGSSTAGIAMDRHGRKAALQISGLSTAVGAGLMGVAPTTILLLFGRQYFVSVVAATRSPVCRFLIGYGAGIGLCTGPIFLAEIAPSNIRGSVGGYLCLCQRNSSSSPQLEPTIRRPYSARHRDRNHGHPTAWLALGNSNVMEIRVLIFLPRFSRPVVSESVHCRDSSVVEAARQDRRVSHCAKLSFPTNR